MKKIIIIVITTLLHILFYSLSHCNCTFKKSPFQEIIMFVYSQQKHMKQEIVMKQTASKQEAVSRERTVCIVLETLEMPLTNLKERRMPKTQQINLLL